MSFISLRKLDTVQQVKWLQLMIEILTCQIADM